MIVFTGADSTFPIFLHPCYVLGGSWLAIRISAGSLLHLLAGFLFAVSSDSKAGSGPSSGCRYRGEMIVVERMNILVLEGFLPAQTGQ